MDQGYLNPDRVAKVDAGSTIEGQNLGELLATGCTVRNDEATMPDHVHSDNSSLMRPNTRNGASEPDEASCVAIGTTATNREMATASLIMHFSLNLF